MAGQLLDSVETQCCRACLAVQGLRDGTRRLLCKCSQVAQLPLYLLYLVRASAATHSLAEYSTTSEAERAACRSEGTVPYMYIDSLCPVSVKAAASVSHIMCLPSCTMRTSRVSV